MSNRRYRNRRIGDFLKELHLTEGRNTGFKKIILYIEENGKITPKEAEKICGKSSATVRRYLKMFAQTGYIKVEGSTNNTIYKTIDRKEE